jgi:osmotically-inducible protein OsmY
MDRRSIHPKLVGALAALLVMLAGCARSEKSYRTTAATSPSAPDYLGVEMVPSSLPQPGQPAGVATPEGQSAPGQEGARSAKAERALSSDVQGALTRAPNLDAKAVHVSVKGGDVYLSGYVPTPEQRRLAHDVAHSVEGVNHVYTRDLQVR